MNQLDYALLGLLGLSALLGFWRGLLSELIALGAWVLAFFAAKTLLPAVQPLAARWVAEPMLQTVLAFGGIFVAVLIVVALARWLLSELIRAAGLGLADRFLGACFGVLRGALIVYVITLLVGFSGFAKENWWRNASLASPLETAVSATKIWLPEPLVKRLRYR